MIGDDQLEATYFRQQKEDRGYIEFISHLLMEGDAVKQLFALVAEHLSLDAGNPRVEETVCHWVSFSMDQQWRWQRKGNLIGPVLGAAVAYLLVIMLKASDRGLSLGIGLGVGGIAAMIILRKKRIPPLMQKALYTLFFSCWFYHWA